MQSRIDPPYPYQGKEYGTAEIQQIAAQHCDTSQSADDAPEINPFTTDGCTMWRDGTWRACCIEHDIQYWCGGPVLNRKTADQALRQCTRERSSPTNAFLIYWGTRLGGSSLFPFPWRWGYGYQWLNKP